MIQLNRPSDGWRSMIELAARARCASDELRDEGRDVRFLRSVFIPEDDACLHLYQAPSADEVRAAAIRADISFAAIAKSLGAGGPSSVGDN